MVLKEIIAPSKAQAMLQIKLQKGSLTKTPVKTGIRQLVDKLVCESVNNSPIL